jgi:hypothetical protein
MPLYLFEEKDGTRHERFFHRSDQCPAILTAANDNEHLFEGNQRAHKVLALPPDRRKQRHAYPILSDALGCHPDDIAATEAALDCKCTPEGQVVVPSRGEHKRMLAAAGMREREHGERISAHHGML